MNRPLNSLTVEHVSVEALKPHLRNARTHSKEQIRQIARSIETFGWTNPVLMDAEGNVIAGHGRVEAAKVMGLKEVPAIRIDHMSEAQKRAYVIADNRLAEKAGWNRELLALELKDLIEIEGLDLDVMSMGFEMAEIDVLIGDLNTGAGEEESEDIPVPEAGVPPVSQLGDLWALGPHRLLCGDARNPTHLEKLMDGAKAEMVFTDPPYNVPISGHVSGLGSRTHEEFAMAVGEMSEAEFTGFLTEVLSNMAAVSNQGAIHFVCMDWRHLYELLSAGREAYDRLCNLCVWTKTNGGMGSLYRSQHELVAVFRHGDVPHINNVELGRHGRYRTNVWPYAGMNSFGAERDEALAAHPTVKPVALVEDAILDCSRRGGIVLDGFSGSGTTLIAADRAGRRGYGLELEPCYVDVTLRRFRNATGTDPVHVASGLTFSQLE